MASRAAQNCLTELNKFEYTVNYALDLHDTVRSLLNYCFGLRDLTNVFTTAVKDANQVNECKEIALRLINYVTNEISRLVQQKNSIIGLSGDDVQSLLDRIILFWEMYKTRDIEALYDMEDLDALDTHMEMIEKTLVDFGLANASRLPQSLAQHLHRGSPIMMNKPVILPLCMRGDELNVKEIPADSRKEPSNQFIVEYDKIVDMLASHRYDFEAMNEAAAQSTEQGFRLSHDQTVTIIEKLLPYWNSLLGYTDLRVRDAFIAMLEKLFSVTGTSTKNAIFERVILHRMTVGQGATAERDADLEGLDGRLTEVLNMIGDHQDLQSNVEKFESVRCKLLWYLLMAPLITLKRILVQCIDNKLVVPAAMKVLHSCSSLFCVEVISTNGGKVPILIYTIENIFVESMDKWENVDMQDSFLYLVTSLARRKRTVIKEKNAEGRVIAETLGEMTEDSLLNGAELVSLLLLPHLMSANARTHHQLMMLKIMQRVFQALGAKDTVFKWTSEIGASWIGLRIVPAPELFILLHRLYVQSEQQNQPVADSCRAILKAFGDKLRDDDLTFTSKTTSYILNGIKQDPWWLRYALVEWFGHSLSSPKHQLPSGLFAALPLEVQERCEQLAVESSSTGDVIADSTAPVSCWLRSLFEMALFDVDLAMDILNHGIAARPVDDHLMEQIALSLADSCGRSFRAVRIVALTPLIDKLIAMLDPSTRGHQLEFLSETTFHALRLLQSILLVSKAAKMAFAKVDHWDPKAVSHYPSASLDRPGDPQVVADELLQAFCEMTKAHMESEMVALRRSLLPVKPEIREPRPVPVGVEMQRDERVLAQLTLLFSEAVIFTRIKPKDCPACLRVLISQLADYLREVQEKQSGRFLDHSTLPQVKTKAVYAYVKPVQSNTESGAEAAEDVAPHNRSHSEQPAVTSPSRESGANFAENKLFDNNSASIDAQPGSSRSPSHHDRHSVHQEDDRKPSRPHGNRRFVDPHSWHPEERQNWQGGGGDYQRRQSGHRGDYRGGGNANCDNANWHKDERQHHGRQSNYANESRQYQDRRQYRQQEQETYCSGQQQGSQHSKDDWNQQRAYGAQSLESGVDGFRAVAAQIENPAMRSQTERRLSERSNDSRGGGANWQQGHSANRNGGNWRGVANASGFANEKPPGFNRSDNDNDSVRSGSSGGGGGGRGFNKRNNRNKKR